MEREGRSTGLLPVQRQAARRRGCLWFGSGLLVGLLGSPLVIWLVLLLTSTGADEQRPTPRLPQQPDVTISLSRSYIERKAAQSASGQVGGLPVYDPSVELAPHPQSGARLTMRGGVDLPLIEARAVATFQLVPVEGKLLVATERVALGNGGQVPLPGQLLIKDWLDELVNQEVQARLRSSSSVRIYVTDISANADQLVVEAMLEER